MTNSDLILLVTAIFIAWQAWETRNLAKLTRIKDQPFLEMEFKNNGAELILKNLGQSPAYSPSISQLWVADNEYFNFDPLHDSRSAIIPNETRKIWISHRKINEDGSLSSQLNSVSILTTHIIVKNINLKVSLQYFDKDGEKLNRILYLKFSKEKYLIYTTTISE